jgi:hypothetical protein
MRVKDGRDFIVATAGEQRRKNLSAIVTITRATGAFLGKSG